MLTINVPSVESFDEENQVFLYAEETKLELEHSLVSLSKWEQVWEKPFLGEDKKTTQETIGYVIAMCQTPNVDREVFNRLSDENISEINQYVDAKMTATWFRENGPPTANREIITSEIIYHWMFALHIPLECEHWHLSRLFTLIKVINEKNQPAKKQNAQEAAQRNREINARRRAELGTSG